MIGHAINVARSLLHEHIKATSRSTEWRTFEKHNLAKACAACGGTKRLQLHHVQPFHLHPELELVASNTITLCMGKLECHLRLGHGRDFKLANPFVVAHAARVLAHPETFDAVAELAREAAHGAH